MVSYISRGHDLEPNISAKRCSLYTCFYSIFIYFLALFLTETCQILIPSHIPLVWCPIWLSHLTPSPLCSLSLLTLQPPSPPLPTHTSGNVTKDHPPVHSSIPVSFINKFSFPSPPINALHHCLQTTHQS